MHYHMPPRRWPTPCNQPGNQYFLVTRPPSTLLIILRVPYQVIREAWARDTQNTVAAIGDDSSSSTGSSSSPSSWSIRRSVVQYSHRDTVLEGLFARPVGEGLPDRLPGVIVAHTAVGPQEGQDVCFFCRRHRMYAVYARMDGDISPTGLTVPACICAAGRDRYRFVVADKKA